jgi:hypothetical protein
MANITVYMKDGTKKEFIHQGRLGGSYTKTCKTEGGFLIITDEYHNNTMIPSHDIKEVLVKPHR